MVRKDEKKLCTRVNSPVLMQDCYILDVIDVPFDKKYNQQSEKVYYELEDVLNSEGDIVERLVKHSYDITPEFVNSMLFDDPVKDYYAAVANGHNRPNLGDIVDYQKYCTMDTVERHNYLDNLQKNISAYLEREKQAKTDLKVQEEEKNG